MRVTKIEKIEQIRTWEKELGYTPLDIPYDEIDDYYEHLYNEMYSNGPIYICDCI